MRQSARSPGLRPETSDLPLTIRLSRGGQALRRGLVGRGLLPAATTAQHLGQGAVGKALVGGQAERGAQTGFRGRELAELKLEESEVAVRLGEGRLHAQRFPVAGLGLFETPE